MVGKILEILLAFYFSNLRENHGHKKDSTLPLVIQKVIKYTFDILKYPLDEDIKLYYV